ncbi:MAG: FAD-dependent oxidoreductase [Patescibacteria group bacterium]
MYDLTIIGGGPAAAGAAVYAGRKKLKTLIITESFGGQSIVSDSIENWIGTLKITGLELAKAFENHIKIHQDVEIKMPEKATAVKEITGGYEVSTNKNNAYQARSIIIASGARRRRLNVLGEDKFDGKGVSYCSTCDAPIFKDKIVAIVGGGNAGAEAVIDLNKYASKIYWISRSPSSTADPETVEEVKKLEKVAIISNAETKEILGVKFVSGIKYLDKNDNQIKELSLEGLFVEIGSVSNSELAKELVEMNKAGEIIVDHKTGATSRPGIFAAGDVTDEIYKQNNISAGDGIAAALSAYNYLLNIKKQSPAQENL